MKTLKNSMLFFVAFISLVQFSACDDENIIDDNQTLTQAELDNLNFLLEEEKMARDVYLYLYDLYGVNIFNNISSSEQRHMDFVIEILDNYDLEYNYLDEHGEFINQDIQTLYDQLTSKGDVSLLEAYLAGITIEDLDIFDLNNAIANTDKADLIEMYETLSCGSRNHMRAFYDKIKAEGSDYDPQYISSNLFSDIITGIHESCNP